MAINMTKAKALELVVTITGTLGVADAALAKKTIRWHAASNQMRLAASCPLAQGITRSVQDRKTLCQPFWPSEAGGPEGGLTSRVFFGPWPRGLWGVRFMG